MRDCYIRYHLKPRTPGHGAVGDAGSAAFIFIVHEPGAELPGQQERALLTAVGDAMPAGTAGCAFVMEAQGFVAAASRSILTGMQLLARSAYPVKFFKDVASAARWAGARTDRPPSVFEEMVARMRATP